MCSTLPQPPWPSVTGLAHTGASPYLVGTRFGQVIVGVVLVVGVLTLVRGYRPPPLTWAVLATMLALWVAEALEYFPGGREAAQSRYQYFGGLLVLIAATAATRGRRPPRSANTALVAATLAICVSNVVMLHDRDRFWTLNSAYARSETGALQVTRGIVQPEFMPENFINVSVMGDHNLTVVRADRYFSAIDSWGSSAYSPAQILEQPEPVRESADLVLSTGERLGPVPGHAPGSCAPAPAAGSARDLTLVPGREVSITPTLGPAALLLRRFATSYRYVHWSLAAHRTYVLRTRADQASLPWRVLVLGGAVVRHCG